MNPLEHRQVLCGFKLWYRCISKILQAIVHDGCPSQLADKKMREANIIVNIFVNIQQIFNIVVSLDCY